MFSLLKMLNDGLEWCVLIGWIIVVFIHCRGSISDVMLNFSKSVLMKKQTHLHLGWTERVYIFSKFHFWVKYSFKTVDRSFFPLFSFALT